MVIIISITIIVITVISIIINEHHLHHHLKKSSSPLLSAAHHGICQKQNLGASTISKVQTPKGSQSCQNLIASKQLFEMLHLLEPTPLWGYFSITVIAVLSSRGLDFIGKTATHTAICQCSDRLLSLVPSRQLYLYFHSNCICICSVIVFVFAVQLPTHAAICQCSDRPPSLVPSRQFPSVIVFVFAV